MAPSVSVDCNIPLKIREVYEYVNDMASTGNCCRRGHRLRIDVAN